MPTAAQVLTTITEAEYLTAERASVLRHEFVGGQMLAMSGASLDHGLVVSNLVASLHGQLAGRDCFVVANDLSVRVAATAEYFYPDVLVVCGDPEFVDERRDVLLNPRVILEVLSPSTKNFDRGEKFASYRLVPGFLEYVLVAQDRCHVEHHERQADGRWLLTEIKSADAILSLRSIGCALPLREIYRRLHWFLA